MGLVFVKCPVTCPICRREALISLRVERVVDMLDDAVPLRLHAPCHPESWVAGPAEALQIRAYLAEALDFTSSSEPWVKQRRLQPRTATS